MVVDGAVFFEQWTKRHSQARTRQQKRQEPYLSDFSSHHLVFNLNNNNNNDKKKQEELAMGEDVARCPSCSLHLHVVFDPGELRVFFYFNFLSLSLSLPHFCSPLLTFPPPPKKKKTTTADFAEFLPGASKQPSSEGGANKAVSVA